MTFRAVDTTLPGDKSRTQLSQSVFSGNTDAIDLLLMRDDVVPSAKNKQGGTPLIELVELGRMAIVQRLLAHHYARQGNPQLMNLPQ
ncbi:hypothetical protein ABVK25_006577 [Lepraria finkii]|uniref:Uncharacterized protein n=1 Tax=Lepraria finkii TaxID=1340010 RepID=A0ABR4B7B3_9LECA